jgi:hypothetical protein
MDFKTHFILNEGGAAGHMSHIYENINLSAAQLKTLFRDLIQGKKENISEKVDGQNIFFTWDEISHTVKFARRTSDIQNGGVDLEDLKTRFANYPANVKAAFIDGGTIIQDTLVRLKPEFRVSVFGKTGNSWINAEIMHTKNPNLIQYSGNYIVLHGMSIYDGSKLVREDNNFSQLTEFLDKQTSNQSEHAWAVVGPRLIKIEQFNTLSGPYGEFCNKIDELFRSYGLQNNNTIADYIVVAVSQELTQLHMPAPAIEAIADTIVGRKKINIPQMKKQYGTAFAKTITEYAAQTNIGKIKDRLTKPIQEAITDIAVEVLKTLSSYFVRDHGAEINRVRNELRSAIATIEQTRDNHSEQRLQILKAQMKKLKSVENFCSTIEGIVFEEPPGSGNIYKLTGAFAPVNQILGLISYGRGAVPPLAQK